MKTSTEWGTFFDEFAPSYEREAFGGAGLSLLSDHELEAIRGALAPCVPGAVLDAGAGTGRITRLLRALGWQVTAIDNSPEMLARLTLADPDLATVHARLGEPLPFVDAAFDAVVSIRVLKYVAATDIALSELARVLRPGGVVVLEVTNANSIARFGYRSAPVHCTTRRTIERQMRGTGLAPVAVVAGPRLPHAAFVRAHGPRTGRAVAAADRALGALLGTAAARSLIIVGRRM